MGTKAVVLLSGGLDSVYNLYRAIEKWPGQVGALFIQYGQRAAEPELKAARYFAELNNVPLQTVDLAPLFQWDQSALTSDRKVPTSEVDIQSDSASESSAKQVWVANRNGVFLSVAAAFAEQLGADFVIPGFNREEAQTFPDNSVGYIEAMNQSLLFSTRNGVQVSCFSQDMDKVEIAKDSQRLGIDFGSLWSCYMAGPEPCGKCESCQRMERGLKALMEN